MENLNLRDEKEELEKLLREHNQGHLIDYLNSEVEDDVQKQNFISKLKDIDYEILNNLYDYYKRKEKQPNQTSSTEEKEIREILPLKDQYSRNEFSLEEKEKILRIGYDKISKGKVALFVLAGGQGSRLGFNKPKGMYNIQMPSNKTIFEYICHRFLSIQNLSKKISNEEGVNHSESILLLLTNKDNNKEIMDFYEENNYFGIKKENVKFIPQDTLPAIDVQGKIILKDRFEIFEAPNGNGGCFISIKNEKILDFLTERNIEYINVVAVDNPLTKVLDPFFIGLTYLKNQKMSAKTIPKTDPKEKVGVFVKLNGKPMMIDYADLDEKMSNLREVDSNKLTYRASNILNYLISVDSLQNILNEHYQELINDFNIAKKIIKSYDFKNKMNENIQGVKFELFFNSIFIFSDNLMLYEVERSEEFAPVKNSDESDTDNPRTTRQLMSNLFKNWLNDSNLTYKDNKDKNGILEISFLISYDGENLDNDNLKNLNIDLSEASYYLDKN